MPHVMRKLSQIIRMSKGDHDTPTFIEAMKGPYKSDFMQTMTNYIKKMEQHGTWTIVYRKSVLQGCAAFL